MHVVAMTFQSRSFTITTKLKHANHCHINICLSNQRKSRSYVDVSHIRI